MQPLRIPLTAVNNHSLASSPKITPLLMQNQVPEKMQENAFMGDGSVGQGECWKEEGFPIE